MPKHLRKLSTGIYRDAYGIRAIVNIAAGRKELRFDPDTPLADIKRWRNQMKVKLEKLHPQKRAGAIGRRTFNADMRRHLKRLTISSWKSRRSELRAWATHLGKTKRRRVTDVRIKTIVKEWHDGDLEADPPVKPVPPKTILNRVRALTAMYHELDGPDAWTPADGVALPKVVKRKPVYVGVETIKAVEVKLRDGESQTHARFLVLTATGARPVHLKRAQPHEVDLQARLWNIPGAKGGEAIELWLNDDMLAALERFQAVNAWGDFDATDYAKAVRAAGWPEGVPPYNAKHALGRDLGDQGVDLETIADWYGHTDTKTTRIYTGVIAAKLKAASQAISGRLGWATTNIPTTNISSVEMAGHGGTIEQKAGSSEAYKTNGRSAEIQQNRPLILVAGGGFEPPTFGL